MEDDNVVQAEFGPDQPDLLKANLGRKKRLIYESDKNAQDTGRSAEWIAAACCIIQPEVEGVFPGVDIGPIDLVIQVVPPVGFITLQVKGVRAVRFRWVYTCNHIMHRFHQIYGDGTEHLFSDYTGLVDYVALVAVDIRRVLFYRPDGLELNKQTRLSRTKDEHSEASEHSTFQEMLRYMTPKSETGIED